MLNTFLYSKYRPQRCETVTLNGLLTFANGGGIYRNVQNSQRPIDQRRHHHGWDKRSCHALHQDRKYRSPVNATAASGGVTPPEGLQINSVIADNTPTTGPVAVVKSGYGVLRLNATNTFTGGLYVNEGQLRAVTASSLGNGNVYIADGGLLFQGAALNIPNNIFMAGFGPIESGFQDGALRFNSAGAGAIFSGTITLTGDSGVTARGGQATSANTGGTISGQITGNFGFSINRNSGQGTSGLTASMPSVTLSNTSNNYGGNTTVGRGRLRLGASEVIPDGSNLIVFGESGSQSIVSLDAHTETVNALMSGAGDNPSFEYVTNTVAGAGVLRVGSANGSGTYAGAIVDNSAGTAVPGGVAVPGTVQLVKLGTGTQILSGTNIYSGGTLIQNGTIGLGADTALPPTGSVTLGDGTLNTSGTLDLAGFSPTVAGLSTAGTGTANIIGNSSSIPSTLTFATGTTTFGGKIQDTLPGGFSTTALTVSSGSLTLGGNSTFTGGATINGGLLAVTGSLLAANITHVIGGTLGGNGNGSTTGLAGTVSVEGGTVRPGTTAGDIGTLAVSSLTIHSGGVTIDLGPSLTSDLIKSLGALTIGDPFGRNAYVHRGRYSFGRQLRGHRLQWCADQKCRFQRQRSGRLRLHVELCDTRQGVPERGDNLPHIDLERDGRSDNLGHVAREFQQWQHQRCLL